MLAMLGVALLACAAGAETTVKGVVAKQRYPWNGLVDVSYTIVTDQPEGTPWTVTATAKNTHTGTVYTRGIHPATGSADPRTLPVGSFAPNGYGLYDMAGNVSEWCWDATSSSSSLRRYYGGDWGGNANSLRITSYSYDSQTTAHYYLGFRCVRR